MWVPVGLRPVQSGLAPTGSQELSPGRESQAPRPAFENEFRVTSMLSEQNHLFLPCDFPAEKGGQ